MYGMGIAKNLEDVDQGFQIVREFPNFQSLPIILSESDPEGCAACSARVYPQNAYRNGPLYASYTAAMVKNILDLADQRKTNIEGMLTWAFEFEDQPYFDGFRTLATNGIDKPILSLFWMLGFMKGDRVSVESSARVPLESMMAEGVRGAADIDALAVAGDRSVSVLVWNYHDELMSPARMRRCGSKYRALKSRVLPFRTRESTRRTAMHGRRGRKWARHSILQLSNIRLWRRQGECRASRRLPRSR